ncbi:hypothetical protein BFW38_06950 [Terasakiispira papahanaumokuakeensis]|uniref:Na+/H+ antiporter NhaC-like C-terminal domain-containing protein n=1 Tax=Terasakiispira papahanaumokuakeensis TaxID=197479 RepID=A0A1E2VE26_9GAMM|nr:Na+/H+ antiporter NhaC family protein [Terasakiispira papahanaumokuakeensis]ODC05258.1 hypothetical protein BFW38_06950 [Terasakiispira papahanaumokuakeensis]
MTATQALLVPILAIGLAIVTRQVLLSLGIGLLVGALQLTDFAPLSALSYLLDRFLDVFLETTPEHWHFNWGKLNILIFLLLLGMVVSLATLSGGVAAFGYWAEKRIRNRRQSQLLTVMLGLAVFIDDYFNSLAVGSISRPIADRTGVSRPKLAYLIDSTAAPVCVLTPISSWGAYIISLLAGIIASTPALQMGPMEAFLWLIPLNYYAISALILVIAAAAWDINLGAMNRYQDEIQKASPSNPRPEGDIQRSSGHARDLLIPILSMVAATVIFLIWTGAQALGDTPFSIMGAMENTDPGRSLMFGGIAGVLAALWIIIKNLHHRTTQPAFDGGYKAVVLAMYQGMLSMMPAVRILVLAWMLTALIEDLQTGLYLADWVSQNEAFNWLPLILFVLAGAMAFATGTSWGTFGIMLPIAGDMALASDPSMLLPMFGAVLAGAVFGDHCSPISDTTILSSTGAGCHHIDHVNTQLPYALIGASTAALGYVGFAMTSNAIIGLLICVGLLISTIALLIRRSHQKGNAHHSTD